MTDDVYTQLAATVGSDAAIEIEAQCFDAVWPGIGLGDALRDCWVVLKRELLAASPRAAASSGAAHELEYFGGPR